MNDIIIKNWLDITEYDLETAKAILESSEAKCPVKKVSLFSLYGSYAKGKETPNSDIDIGVVIDFNEHSQRVALTAELFHYAAQVDNRIEPKCIFGDEYNNHDKASILADIIRTGVEIS